VFRAIEKTLTTPPQGRIAQALHGRRRRRVEQVIRDFQAGAATA
jgi:hypothetical protein